MACRQPACLGEWVREGLLPCNAPLTTTVWEEPAADVGAAAGRAASKMGASRLPAEMMSRFQREPEAELMDSGVLLPTSLPSRPLPASLHSLAPQWLLLLILSCVPPIFRPEFTACGPPTWMAPCAICRLAFYALPAGLPPAVSASYLTAIGSNSLHPGKAPPKPNEGHFLCALSSIPHA